MIHEVAPLVALGGEPDDLAVGQHRVEQHHSFDGTAQGDGLPVAVVRFAERRVQRLVLDVEEASASGSPDSMRRGEPACQQALDEVVDLLPVRDAREGRVVPAHEDAVFLAVIGVAALAQKQDARASGCLTVMPYLGGIDVIECGPYGNAETAYWEMYYIASSAATVYSEPAQFQQVSDEYYSE